jgi:hypothetical protein
MRSLSTGSCSLVCVMLLSFSLSGCAKIYKTTVEFDSVQFNSADPLRVAVLPFYQMVDGKPQGAAFEASLAIDSVPLLSSKPIDSPASYVEEAVRTALTHTGMEVVNPSFVRLQLGHHGFVRERVISVPVLLESSPKRLGELLLADAVLYGTVTDWSRSYYGLESINTVGIDLRLVRTADGAELWKASAKESQGRGLSGIPTGFSSLVLEPLKGLDQKNIEQLASKVVNKTFEPLVTKRKAAESSTPGPVLLGAVAFGRLPTGQRIGKGAGMRMTILAVASPGKRVSARMISQGLEYGLLEGEPGHYTSEFEVDSIRADRSVREIEGVKAGEVEISVTDEFGRVAKRSITIRG